jgi:hypothetical protein
LEDPPSTLKIEKVLRDGHLPTLYKTGTHLHFSSMVKRKRKENTPPLTHLCILGGRDFRLTTCESLSAFTVLQKRGIPSRFVYFPDENHWVLKPANSARWHKEGNDAPFIIQDDLTIIL